MVFKKIAALIALICEIIIIALICVIKLCTSEKNNCEDPLIEPWIVSVQVPNVTPTYIRLISSNFCPVTNTYNRFVSATVYESDLIINTGKILLMQAATNTSTFTVGGVVGLDQFMVIETYFLWDLDLCRAGTLLDGEGAALEVGLILVNVKYNLEDALNHRDGFFIDIIRVNVVDGIEDNPKYANFKNTLNEVSKAGSSSEMAKSNLAWLGTNYTVYDEMDYCYPGQYKNYTSNVVTNSATICLRHADPLPTISKSDFLNSFGMLRNQANKPYSSIEPLKNASSNTPFGIFGPVLISFEPH